ncbi:MAG: aromatic aminobenezylarsenical efflux permease ArsG family transporter [Planctomycetota bacterium]
MSIELMLAAGSALWVGLLTAISPCPLATNVAAISFIGRGVARPSAVVVTGVLYALGRSLVYVVLAVLLVSSLLSAPAVAHALERWVNRLIGPLLVVVGMFLLGLIRWTGRGSSLGARVGERVKGWGALGGLALGVLFALSFCPVSAALYFGTLIPLAVKSDSRVLLPLVYGAGTALPVLAFAVVIALGTNALGRAYERVAHVERWARRITGGVFVLAGTYLTLVYVYRVL